ncbi:hypothetical protein PBNK5_24000 [Pectobacterium brasiliense]
MDELIKKRFKHSLLFLTLCATGAMTSAFAAQVPAGVELADKQELVRGNGSEPASLDPH